MSLFVLHFSTAFDRGREEGKQQMQSTAFEKNGRNFGPCPLICVHSTYFVQAIPKKLYMYAIKYGVQIEPLGYVCMSRCIFIFYFMGNHLSYGVHHTQLDLLSPGMVAIYIEHVAPPCECTLSV